MSQSFSLRGRPPNKLWFKGSPSASSKPGALGVQQSEPNTDECKDGAQSQGELQGSTAQIHTLPPEQHQCLDFLLNGTMGRKEATFFVGEPLEAAVTPAPKFQTRKLVRGKFTCTHNTYLIQAHAKSYTISMQSHTHRWLHKHTQSYICHDDIQTHSDHTHVAQSYAATHYRHTTTHKHARGHTLGYLDTTTYNHMETCNNTPLHDHLPHTHSCTQSHTTSQGCGQMGWVCVSWLNALPRRAQIRHPVRQILPPVDTMHKAGIHLHTWGPQGLDLAIQ